MYYYKRHIGDYVKKTAHLSPLEHGVYNLILDAYYDREKAPTLMEATRWARARTEEEKQAVLGIMDEYFTLHEDGTYRNDRVEEELSAYHAMAETNRLIAVAREEKKRLKREQVTEEKPSVERTEHESCEKTHEPFTVEAPNQEPLTTNHKPSTTTSSASGDAQEYGPDDVRLCPVGSIVDLYHELMPLNPRVKVLNETRRRAIRQRWKEAAALQSKPFGYSTRAQGLDAWRLFFEVCAGSEFLTGRSPAQAGRPPFIADIDFLFSPAGFAKILENKYHRAAA